MNGAEISEILIRRGKRVCTSKDISEMFPDSYLSVISNLINTKWITPIKGFRGIYYVSDPDEKVRSYFKTDSFQILVMVLKSVLGSEWYFGKMSAISLLGLIHQPVSVYYVINKLHSKSIDSNIF